MRKKIGKPYVKTETQENENKTKILVKMDTDNEKVLQEKFIKKII